MFKIKKYDTGKLVKLEVQLVVKRFVQTKRIYFDEISSPVVKMTSVRVVLGLIATMNLELKQMDVKTTFVHGDLNEKIYITQPEGFEAEEK